MTSDRLPASRADDSEPARSPLLAFVDALLENGGVEARPGLVKQRTFLELVVGEATYFLPLLDCREITRVPEIARVPESPPGVRGMVSVRGKILPVMDTRACLGLATTAASHKARLVLVEAQNRVVALLVDRITGIAKVDETAIEPRRDPDPAYIAGYVSYAGRSGPILSTMGLFANGNGPRVGREG